MNARNICVLLKTHNLFFFCICILVCSDYCSVYGRNTVRCTVNVQFKVLSKVVCPDFGHHALTSSVTKYECQQVKNSFPTIVNGLLVLKLFKLSNGDLLFSQHAYSIYKVRKLRLTKLGQVIRIQGTLPHGISPDNGIFEVAIRGSCSNN